MEIFTQLFSFLWSLLSMSVTIGSYTFSLGGAVIYAALVICFIWFIHWLFADD